MTTRPLILSMALAGMLSTTAFAQSNTSPAQRYESDKKLCSEERSSDARMQCLRDARSEYDKVLARDGGKPNNICHECATVVSVRQVKHEGQGSALGLIGGGVVGGLLGNQVGSGHGRQLATVAGAAGGAYAGNQIEKSAKSSVSWNVTVQYEDGKKRTFDFAQSPGLASGDHVVNKGNSIVRR